MKVVATWCSLVEVMAGAGAGMPVMVVVVAWLLQVAFCALGGWCTGVGEEGRVSKLRPAPAADVHRIVASPLF